jgi:HlyD family secretion protein
MLGVLAFVPVDITISAAGMVRPATERIELKAPFSGRVVRVLAKDNEGVKAGAALLEISSRDAMERLERNQAIQREKAGTSADLLAVIANITAVDWSSGDGSSSPVPAPALGSAALTRSYLQFVTQLSAVRLALGKARVAHDRSSALAGRGVVSLQETESTAYAQARALAELQVLVQQTLFAWESQLRDERAALGQLRSEEKRMQDEVGLALVRAPADGTVQGLIGLTAGSYVLAGQSLGFVTPEDRLQVETVVSTKDIGLVHEGQAVRLQVDAYPYTQWGLLGGTVESVAADATASGAQAGFRITVRPVALALHRRDGGVGRIRKGMTLTARFTLGRRTLLEVLYQDASRWLDPRARSGAA